MPPNRMTNKQTDVLKKLEALRDTFKLNLAKRLGKISVIIEKLNPSAPHHQNLNLLKELQHLLHKLAGSAGTFGFHNITQLSRQQESICLDLLKKTKQLTPIEIHSLNKLDSLIKNLASNKVLMTTCEDNSLGIQLNLQDESTEEKKKVVLIEDDKSLSKVLQKQLFRFGFHLIVISKPETLKQKLEHIQPLAIIVNIAFPYEKNMNLKTINNFREQKKRHCPMFFISDRNDIQARLQAVRCGGDIYLPKPIDSIELIEHLNRLNIQANQTPYRVLIIDDDPEVAEFNQVLLSCDGMFAEVITDPFKTLDRLNDSLPDVILMDIEMPGCNGYELAKIIRQDNRYIHIPIICLSGACLEDDLFIALESGGDEFLRKSDTPRELRASILALAKRSREFSNLMNKLSKSESSFRAVAQTAQDAIITVDLQGRIIYWNKAAQNMFDYQNIEIIGSDFTQLLATHYKKIIKRAFNQTVINKQYDSHNRSFEFKGLRKTGEFFSAELTFSCWNSDGGVFFTGIIRDISEHKRREKALVESKHKANKANQAKSEFLSNMSHELRTPLNAILGFSQLLEKSKKSSLSEKQKSQVHEISKGGRHLLELVNDILELTKVEVGKLPFYFDNINIQSTLEECLALLRPMADKRGIKIISPSSFLTTYVVADDIRLKQALLNLISNAIKYNKDCGQIILSFNNITDGQLRLNIQDTGKGIPLDKQREIFEPFNRLGAEQSEIEGTGIGLILTKKLIESMHGTFGFSSQEDIGSTFWFELPMADGNQSSRPKTSLKESQTERFGSDPGIPLKVNGETGINFKGTKKLLYIEDNVANLKLIETYMREKTDIIMYSARNAEQGIELARKEQPDIILMDINLPGINGIEALKILKQMKETNTIPVFALTADAMPDSRQKGLEAGFECYFNKPINLRELNDKIEERLQSASRPIQ